MRNKTSTLLIIALTIAMLVLSACAQTTILPNPNVPGSDPSYNQQIENVGDFVKFQSVEAYKKFAAANSGGNNYYAMNRGGMVLSAMEVGAPTAGAMKNIASDSINPSNAPSDFSTTNVQVEGIDESDTTKTDGSYIYTITDNTVFIVKAFPGKDSEIVSQIKMDSYPSGLLVEGNTLVVMGNDYGRITGWIPQSGKSYAYLYDISNKEEPSLENNLTFEGSFYQARLKDGYVYFVSTSYPEYRGVYPLPMMMKNGVTSEISIDRMYMHPMPYDSAQTVQIHGIKLSDATVQSTALTVESTQTMYMSNNNIYLAATKYTNEYEIQQQITEELIQPYISSEQKSLIKKINNVDDEVLSAAEKKSKILQVYYEAAAQLTQMQQQDMEDEAKIRLKEELRKIKYFENTIIDKLSYEDGLVTPVATGSVPGSVNNQFSMDENDGVLRVATSLRQQWLSVDIDETSVSPQAEKPEVVAPSNSGSTGSASSKMAVGAVVEDQMIAIRPMPPIEPTTTKSQNMVFTLDENLDVLGSIKGIAVGEQIYSTRFTENRLYMVTFRQVDPFFVIDLSDASNPKILGELKIPGFSRYLHPMGDNLVVGLGQDASAETGRIKGLKISIFDATNVESPREIASYKGGEENAQSTALFDHHAFLLAPQKDLLVIPVQYYNWEKQGDNYAGALVFKITDSSIKLRGLVNHMQNTNDVWNAQVERSLYIENELFTKSRNLLRVNDLETLASIKDVKLISSTTQIPGTEIY